VRRKYVLKQSEKNDLIDLAEIETTDAEVMTEVEEEMNGEILAEIIVETSAAETTDVAMTGITALEDMTGEILMETMIGIVQNAIIPTLLEEWNVTDVVLQSQVVETLVVEIQTVEIPAEETSETGILDVEILAEETSETGIQGTGPGLEKRRFLQIMIGPAQSVTTPIFLSVKNVTGVASQRVVTLAEVTTEVDEIVNQEMTGQAGMTESQENLEKQEVNPQITPTTGDRNRLMLVLEEEIAMIK